MQSEEITKKILKLETLLPAIFVSTKNYSGFIEISWKEKTLFLKCHHFFDIKDKCFKTSEISTSNKLSKSELDDIYKKHFGDQIPPTFIEFPKDDERKSNILKWLQEFGKDAIFGSHILIKKRDEIDCYQLTFKEYEYDIMLEAFDKFSILNNSKTVLFWCSEMDNKYPKRKLEYISSSISEKKTFKVQIMELLNDEIDKGIKSTKNPNVKSQKQDKEWDKFFQRISVNVIVTDGEFLDACLLSVNAKESEKYSKYFDLCQNCIFGFTTISANSNGAPFKTHHITSKCRICNGELALPKTQEKLLQQEKEEKEELYNSENL